MIPTRVLFVTHGRRYAFSNPGYRILANNYSDFIEHGVFLDIDPRCDPTHVVDVTDNLVDFFEEQFDYIFCMYTPANVLRSKQFWYNISGWLKPGGIVHTILPRTVYKLTPDYMFGFKIYRQIGLEPLKKGKYIVRKYRNDAAVIMQKQTNNR